MNQKFSLENAIQTFEISARVVNVWERGDGDRGMAVRCANNFGISIITRPGYGWTGTFEVATVQWKEDDPDIEGDGYNTFKFVRLDGFWSEMAVVVGLQGVIDALTAVAVLSPAHPVVDRY